MTKKQIMDDTRWESLKTTALAERMADPRFQFGAEDYAYIESRGMTLLRTHVIDFVRRRIAPAFPKNEGRQTPLRGHPVFLAQHATGTHSRRSIQEVYEIPVGREMTPDEVDLIVAVIFRWIDEQVAARPE
jgi:hypothetical protein